ncbi:MAG TPA: tRNA (adenosine(37)-N6)-threonylcarbamoyltransferase complex dimerization subunit type 1 TsaB [Moraxellaceae bacterium]|nr:tRNA (adenosine(37)-N6)-threonylcarbamoyltransferase complex dimerization subunit type 1 TsaB [Moraxellaceae bacterium]
MKLLALETSTEACSVALSVDGRVVSRFRHAPRLQTDLLLPMTEEVLAEAGLGLGDLDALAYSRGPGAFTGVRIAAAAVQAFAFARDLPVVAVSSLQALAQGAWRVHGATRVLSVFDARMDEVYVAGFALGAGRMLPLGEEHLCAPGALPAELRGEWFAAGNGVAAYADVLAGQCALAGSDATLFPSAEDVLPLAEDRFVREGGQRAELALPVYLRDEVWKKLPGR